MLSIEALQYQGYGMTVNSLAVVTLYAASIVAARQTIKSNADDAVQCLDPGLHVCRLLAFLLVHTAPEGCTAWEKECGMNDHTSLFVIPELIQAADIPVMSYCHCASGCSKHAQQVRSGRKRRRGWCSRA